MVCLGPMDYSGPTSTKFYHDTEAITKMIISKLYINSNIYKELMAFMPFSGLVFVWELRSIWLDDKCCKKITLSQIKFKYQYNAIVCGHKYCSEKKFVCGACEKGTNFSICNILCTCVNINEITKFRQIICKIGTFIWSQCYRQTASQPARAWTIGQTDGMTTLYRVPESTGIPKGWKMTNFY